MISIILPAYNAELTLPACLAALQKQTQPPDEIIVVDDGSQDKTADVARAYGVQLYQQPHQGPAAARNLGLSQASGDIVLFTDADCEPVPTWAAEMLRPFVDSRVMGVKGSYRTHQSQCVARLAQCEFEERYDRLDRLETIDFIDTNAAAFRMDAIREMGGFDLAFSQAGGEDTDLSYRLVRAGRRLMFNRQAVVYHRHPSTWRAYFRRKISRAYWGVMVYRLHPAKAVRGSYTPQLLKAQIALMALLLGFSGLAFVFPALLWGALAALTCLWFSALPFARRAAREDRALLIAAPFFILARSLAFVVGLSIGTIGLLFFRPVLPRSYF